VSNEKPNNRCACPDCERPVKRGVKDAYGNIWHVGCARWALAMVATAAPDETDPFVERDYQMERIIEYLRRIDFAELIFAVRWKLGVSQKKLGELMGYSHQSISRWENRRQSPSNEAIRTMAMFLIEYNLSPKDVMLELKRFKNRKTA